MKQQDIFREAYESGNPLIPDEVYDGLFGSEETELDDNRGSKELIPHRFPMLSLHTHFIQPGIAPNNLVHGDTNSISAKLDGVSGSFEIENGVIVRGLSRGKRHSGYQVPKELLSKYKHNIGLGEISYVVRGEFVMTTSAYEERWKHIYKSPRACVSAAVNSDNPSHNLVDDIDFLIHRMYDSSGNVVPHKKMVELLGANLCAPYIIGNAEDALNYLFHIPSMVYPCDGIVVEVTPGRLQNNNRVYDDTIAIKFQADERYSADTVVERITWNQNTDGSLTPLVWYTPVIIDGTECKKASGHCLQVLTKAGIGVGAKVTVSKQGGVIPHITKVHERSENYDFPENVIEPQPGDVQLYSSNSEEAIARIKFIRGMHALDLDDCGHTQFNALFDAGFKTLFDLEPLKGDALQELISRGFQNNITTRNLAFRIHERITTFDYVWCILGLNIPNVGFKVAMKLGQIISGYITVDTGARGAGKTLMAEILRDQELIQKIKDFSKPVGYNMAEPDVQMDRGIGIHFAGKPTNGMTKAKYAETLPEGYFWAQNIEDAKILYIPEGYSSGTVARAIKMGLDIQIYK